AGFLAVGDDVDDAAALLGAGRQFLGRGEDGIVEGVNLLGDGDKRAASRRAAGLQVGVDAVAVLSHIAAGKRTAVDGDDLLGAGRLGHGEYKGHACTLSAGEAARAILRTVAVSKDFYLVIGSKRALDGAQGVVHLFHYVRGQALVEDKNDGERSR